VPAPIVSCILTTHDDARINLARKAVNNFVKQHYVPYQLIVVNGGSQSVLTNDSMADLESDCSIFEVYAPANTNVSKMRNMGLSAASGDWVICIDDDDYFHPARLMYQMAHRIDNAPCLLKYQLRIDISEAIVNNANFIYAVKPLLHLQKNDTGIPCTMLFPRLNAKKEPWFFNPEIEINEYAELLARMLQHNKNYVVCDNRHNSMNIGLHWPLLSVGVYHGNNQLTYENFFSGESKKMKNMTPYGLNSNDIDHLKYILQTYNFKVS
jgi:glycosyltransferase involved in cell wall biosynthesis